MCFDFKRKRTEVLFMTFIRKLGVSLLRQHLEGKRLRVNDGGYTMPLRTLKHQFQRLGRAKLGAEYESYLTPKGFTLPFLP